MENIIQQITRNLVENISRKAFSDELADLDRLAADLFEDCADYARNMLQEIISIGGGFAIAGRRMVYLMWFFETGDEDMNIRKSLILMLSAGMLLSAPAGTFADESIAAASEYGDRETCAAPAGSYADCGGVTGGSAEIRVCAATGSTSGTAGIPVYLDGELLELDVPATIIDGRTMVPFRGIFEAFGMTVSWAESSRTVIATGEKGRLEMTVGDSSITLGDSTIESDVPPQIIDGRTMVPLRVISRALGAGVTWDSGSGSVRIDSTGKTDDGGSATGDPTDATSGDPQSTSASANSGSSAATGSTDAPDLTAFAAMDDSAKRRAVVNYALSFVGVTPYKYAGNSLTTGTDCSGFVHLIYAAFGYSVPRSSSAMAAAGRAVTYDEMQPGDIICYSGHCAMYIGNGSIVHARNESLGTCVTDDPKYRTIVAIRRVIG